MDQNPQPTIRATNCETPALDRRAMLSAVAAACAGALVPSHALAATRNMEGLKTKAAARGIVYGAEITVPVLANPSLAKAIAREAAIITPGVEMKWGATEKLRGKADYSDAETLARFAGENRLALRGHAALWYRNIPVWARPLLDGPRGKDILLKRTSDVIGHFRGRVAEWDVVNEAIDPRDGNPTGLRKWPPFAKGDPGYIAEAFHAAKDADPKALLYYNDYGFVYDNPRAADRRKTAIALIENLMNRGAPINGFGVQTHLKVGSVFSPKIFGDFLRIIADYKLRIGITELDVNDSLLPADIAIRDKAVAEHAGRVLGVALAVPAVKSVITWGLTDSFTWLNSKSVRQNNVDARPLPLDRHLARKPLWYAIADAFDNAPHR